jgi:uncharacterized protein YukE
MAENFSGVVQDEGLSHMEAFVALLTDTRRALAERQHELDSHADTLSSQAQHAATRVQAFEENVSGLAETFAATAHTAAVELSRLAQVSGELAAHLRGEGADALHDSEERFTAGVEGARARLTQGADHLGTVLSEVQQHAERGEEHIGTLVAEQEEGFYDLVTTVAEADTNFSQSDFDLQGALHATTAYVGEGLEQYMAQVFNAFFDHLENQLPPFLNGLFQDLTRDLHRALDEYDSLVESLSGDLTHESETLLGDAVEKLKEAHRDRDDESRHSLSVINDLHHETEHCASEMTRGAQICNNYPPIAPTLATAKEVADRVQDMMDMMNPFA